jgi:tripartite-type tricarboxylate transporter receptor subunit TctC
MHARAVVLILAFATFAAGLPPAAAQMKRDAAKDYPTRPIRVIVPFGTGSITDILTRVVMPRVSEGLGQPVIVDNRPDCQPEVSSPFV